MAVRIPLPKYETLPEGIYFHRRYKHDVHAFVVQIPDDARLDSETHVIDLRDSMHKSWVEGLKNSRNLLTTLQWAEHVAFCPRTGYFEEMPDLDEVSPIAKVVAQARSEAGDAVKADRFFAQRSNIRARAQMWSKPSRLRRALGRTRRRGR